MHGPRFLSSHRSELPVFAQVIPESDVDEELKAEKTKASLTLRFPIP